MDEGQFRNRTIRWEKGIDVLAERIAAQNGYTQAKGGVSKFLSDLVEKAATEDRNTRLGFDFKETTVAKQLAEMETRITWNIVNKLGLPDPFDLQDRPSANGTKPTKKK